MSNENGQSNTEQPLTEAEEAALFEEIFKTAAGGEPSNVSNFKTEEESAAGNETETEATQEEAANTEQGKDAQESEAAKAAEEKKKQELIEREKYEAALREKQEWEQKARSLDGREAARQRQIAQLERELAETRARQQVAQAPQKTAPKNNEKLEALKAADPDLYDILVERENLIRKEAEEIAAKIINERVEPIYRQQQEDYTSREYNRLKEMIPNVDEILQSDYYAWWYDSQTPEIKRRANESADAAAFVIRKWYADMQQMYPQDFQQAPKETTTNNTNTTDVAKLQEAREKRSNTQGVTQKNAPTPKKESLTEEELFAQAFNQSITKRR